MAKSRRVLPGFGLSLGYTVVYLSILVLIPFSGLLLKTFSRGVGAFLQDDHGAARRRFLLRQLRHFARCRA